MDMGTRMAWCLELGAHWHTYGKMGRRGNWKDLARFVLFPFAMLMTIGVMRALAGWCWGRYGFTCFLPATFTSPYICHIHRQMWEEILGLLVSCGFHCEEGVMVLNIRSINNDS
jgi:hypothetical protein